MRGSGGSRLGWLAIAAAVAAVVLMLGVDWSGDSAAAPADKREALVAAAAKNVAEAAREERSPSPFGDGPVVAGPDAPPRGADGAPALPAAPTGSSGIPPGMTADQWRQLNDALRDHPEREAEIARITSFVAFNSRVQQFHTQRTVGARPATLQPLAEQLQTEIGERLKRGELTLAEAENLETELLEVLETDTAARERSLAQWRSEHAATPGPEIDPREAEFGRQLAAAVENWQTLPEEQRDPQQLEAQLQAIRDSLYPSTPPKP